MKCFDLISGRAMMADLPADSRAMRAEGTVTLPAGDYEPVTIADDGIRVFIDDKDGARPLGHPRFGT